MGRERNIGIVAVLNVCFTLLEIAGGLLTNSMAILADAIHDSGDSLALITSWILERKSKKPADTKRTFGYHRLSLFAALLSAAILIGGSLFILSASLTRLRHPQHVFADGMMGFALIGIVFNGAGFLRLRKGQALNEKVLSWHFLEDILGWFVILIGSLIIKVWNVYILDPAMTIGFTAFILWGVGRNLKESLNVLMEGVPSCIDLDRVKDSLLSISGVMGLHDVHVWSLEGETNMFTGHIVVDDKLLKKPNQTRMKIKEILKNHQIEHSTTELESEDFCSGIECALKKTEPSDR